MTLDEHYELLKQNSLEFTKAVEHSKVDRPIKEAVLAAEQSRNQLTETIKNLAMKSFFSQVFAPIRKPKVRIQYSDGIFVLVDDADQNLGYEFKNFNEAFRFAKSLGYEFADNDYFI